MCVRRVNGANNLPYIRVSHAFMAGGCRRGWQGDNLFAPIVADTAVIGLKGCVSNGVREMVR